MPTSILDRLEKEILIGDGAIGTLLYSRGVPLNVCYDELNVSRSDLVSQVHQDYIQAGADIIETNTYGANRFKLAKFGLEKRLAEINWQGARLAKKVAEGSQRKTGRSVFVAGSVGPVLAVSGTGEGISDDEMRAAYREQIGSLLEGGVDVIIFETFTHLSELSLALEVFQNLHTCPVFCSLSVSDSGVTADGKIVSEAFVALRAAGADVVGLNCHIGPLATLHVLEKVPVDNQTRIGVWPNAGHPEFHDGRYFYFAAPEYFGNLASQFVAQGARIVGGCCGTTPETIAAIAQAVRGLKPVTKKALKVPARPISQTIFVSERPSRPIQQRPVAPLHQTILETIQQRTLIVVEFDPPRTLGAEDKFFAGSRALKEAGVDAITLADNSLAILRTSNMAMGCLIKERVGVLPLLHLSCRDRNLIGTQSELLGYHALGIDHVLALTGDPAKTGDHPGATSVYDLNSITLIALMKRMNEGFTLSGRELKGHTRFVIGCSFNPNVKNLSMQVQRLERKLEAGAQIIMSKPIFERAQAKQVYEAVKGYSAPMLLGVMPLLSGRNAEFLHNEVPGIIIPDSIRERMRGKEKEEGVRLGLEIARELAEEILTCFRGIYYITPMMRYDMTVELARFARGRRSV